jgi:glycosyltransferase involved in cell wall biosynthesis
MRFAYFADTRFPLERANGIQTFETCHALARAGHDVALAVRADTHRPSRDAFEFYGAPRLDGLRIHQLPLVGPPAARRLAYLGWALEIASRRDADVVFTRDLGVASALLRLPRQLRPPLVYESHGLAAAVGAQLGELLSTGRNASSAKQRRLGRRERRVWQTADGYVTITARLAEELAGAFGPRAKVATVPDGARVDPARAFHPLPAGPRFVAGYAGHLYPWKGVDVFVRALSMCPEVEGLIVGGHPGEPDLARVQALAGALDVDTRIRFTGLLPPSRVAEQLVATHAVVLPNVETSLSASFTSPLKLFEYLAAGRAIVASDLPAFREVLTGSVSALLVPAGDPAAMAAALAALRDDRALAERLARGAFALAGEYSWEARARRIVELVCAVVGPRGEVAVANG